MKANFVLCSDLHGEFPVLPNGDFLILGGDLGPNLRSIQEDVKWFNENFFPWLEKQPHRHKIIIAGNHDFAFEQKLDDLKFPDSVFYLADSSATIGGIKFHGSPRTPQFGEWAFMDSENCLRYYWERIPSDTEVLITHGPPHGIRDEVPRRKMDFSSVPPKVNVVIDNAGSKTLRERLSDLHNLKLHVFGHIHEGYGKSFDGKVWYVNASFWDGQMRNNNMPLELEIGASS